MIYRFWTSSEINILKGNYGKISIKDLQVMLPNRSLNAIWSKAEKLGLKSGMYMSDNDKKFILKHYPNKRNLWISKKINKSHRTIISYAKKIGLKKDKEYLRRIFVQHNLKINKGNNWKKFWINLLKKHYNEKPKEFFLKKIPKKWETIVSKAHLLGLSRQEYYHAERINKTQLPNPSKEFAWFLGVLAGDGCVTQGSMVLFVKDREFAEKFSRVGQQLFKIKPSNYKLTRGLYGVSFSSKNIKDKIGDWKSNKWVRTLTTKYNWINEKKIHLIYFLRGIFDSEGSIWFKNKNNGYGFSIAAQDQEANKYIFKSLERFGVECKQTKYKGKYKDIVSSNILNTKIFANLINSSIKRKEDVLAKFRIYQI